jgi:hypothetical protein
MQAAIGWILFAGLAYLAWKVYRSMRNVYRNAVAARSEAFSNAVSEAVASGVATAISAAVADSHAAATGGNVAVHIGDNVARLLANHDDNAMRPVANKPDNVDAGRSSVGSVQDSTRHRELASGRTIRGSTNSRPNECSVRVVPTENGA